MSKRQIVIDTNVLIAALLSQYGASYKLLTLLGSGKFENDPKDEMVLELAVAAGCDTIVTYNKRDFRGVEKFGIRLLTAQEFLQELGELP